MKLKKLVCLDFNGSELEKPYWKELDVLVEKYTNCDTKEVVNHTDADGLFVKLGAKLDKNFIDTFPHLRYIGMLGTGYGGIDIDYAASKNITVTNIADYATESVAEFTFGILLENLREISKARTQAKSGDYSDAFIGREIKGKKFGIIGLGNIGTRTAQLAQAFGAEVSYWSKNRKTSVEEKGITYAELDDLLANSDIITLNVAYNPETENIINAHRINLIQKHCTFINVSPMELLDLTALLERLTKGDFTFLLDHSDEVDEESRKKLEQLDNVVTYPAIAYLSEEAGQLKKRIYIDNLKNFLAGKPTHKVN